MWFWLAVSWFGIGAPRGAGQLCKVSSFLAKLRSDVRWWPIHPQQRVQGVSIGSSVTVLVLRQRPAGECLRHRAAAVTVLEGDEHVPLRQRNLLMLAHLHQPLAELRPANTELRATRLIRPSCWAPEPAFRS